MAKAWLYITTNIINGKQYIGQTTNIRPNYLGSGEAIKNAIQKYGRNNFIRENICEGDWEEIDRLEYEMIKNLDAVKSPLFYNLKDGGHHGSHSEQVKKKMSESAKLRRDSDETRKIKSEAHKGIKNHFYGQTHSDESISKIKEARKNQVFSEETNKKRSEAIKTLPKFECPQCGGWYYKRHLNQSHNGKSKKCREASK